MLVRIASKITIVMKELEIIFHEVLMHYHETNEHVISKCFVIFIPLCSPGDANLVKVTGTALDENRDLVST